MEHDLKVWPEFFEPLLTGEKTFEIRLNDRGFRNGDTLLLREWDQHTQAYTGRKLRKLVASVVSGWGLQDGYVCMAVHPL